MQCGFGIGGFPSLMHIIFPQRGYSSSSRGCLYLSIRILWEFNGGNHEYHHTLGWTRVRGRGHEPRTAMSTNHFMLQGLNQYDRLLLGPHRSQLPVKSHTYIYIYIYNERMKQVCYICLDTCRYACRCVCVCMCMSVLKR